MRLVVERNFEWANTRDVASLRVFATVPHLDLLSDTISGVSGRTRLLPCTLTHALVVLFEIL
jgi:hypothetical protein